MDDGIAASARLIGEIRDGAFAAPVTRRRRPLVIIVGAEACGSLLCSRILSVLGFRMADSATAPEPRALPSSAASQPAKPSEIAELHDRLLALFNGGSGVAADDLVLPVSWWADPRVSEIRRQLAAFVNDRVGTGRFGFHDPRTTRLMPIWNQIAKELKLAPKIIHCLRNPAQIARVLHERDGIPLGLAEYRWFAQTVELFRHARKAEICTIGYDEWFIEPRTNLQKLRQFLALPDELPEADLDGAVTAIVEDARPDSDLGTGEARQPLVRSAYRLARRADHDAGARDQLQHIAGQLVSFQQLHAASSQSAESAATASEHAPQKARRDISSGSALRYCVSPASFWQPEHVVPSAWHEHAPFAFWLTDALRPGIFVELGAHNGFSYLVFCQAVQRLGGMTKCYAVDTWKGDEHAGFYGEDVFTRLNELHEPRYSGFSRLVRSTFDEALPHFGDGTIDLLHIDGRHRYDDVAHDFASWLPKLSDRAVVLFHDINVRERGFGVWQFWADLQARYRSFEFAHGHGLGVLQVGRVLAEPLRPLFDGTPEDKAAVAQIYAQLGRMATAPDELERLRTALRERDARLAAVEQDAAALRKTLGEAESWARDREATIELLRAEMAPLRQAAAATSLLEQELQRVRAQITELRDTVAQAERETAERRAAEPAMRTEIADALEIARGHAEAAVQSAAALDIAERRASEAEQVAQAAERRAQEAERSVRRASEAEQAAWAAERRAREAERSIAETLERRARDAEALLSALRHELAVLKTELDDSRQVGRAAIQALATSNPSYAYREPRLGWRQAVRWLFGGA